MIATKSSSDDILRPILAHVTKRVELAIVSHGYPVKHLKASALAACNVRENMRKLNFIYKIRSRKWLQCLLYLLHQLFFWHADNDGYCICQKADLPDQDCLFEYNRRHG